MKVRKIINIKKDLFYNVFTLQNEIFGWGLAPSELKILSELYNLDFDMKSSGKVKTYTDRMSILFSSDSKKIIMDKFKLSYNTFNNSLSKLRKKGFVVKNTIDEKRSYDLNRNTFNFNIEFMTKDAFEAWKLERDGGEVKK